MRSLTLALLAACTGTTPKTTPTDSGTSDTGPVDDWQPVSYIDEGTVCVDPGDPDFTFTVTAPDCMSSSCSRNLGGSCTVTVDGADITVTSDVHWEDNVGEGVSCTDDCGIPMVQCTLPALPDGTYTVHLGSSTTTLTVPITDPCYPYPF